MEMENVNVAGVTRMADHKMLAWNESTDYDDPNFNQH